LNDLESKLGMIVCLSPKISKTKNRVYIRIKKKEFCTICQRFHYDVELIQGKNSVLEYEGALRFDSLHFQKANEQYAR
jgi:hypothetical protein